MAKPVELDDVWLTRIAGQVNGLEYGSVLITIHDGRIVQIDRTERKRFDASSASPSGSAEGSAAEQGRGIPFPRSGRRSADAQG